MNQVTKGISISGAIIIGIIVYKEMIDFSSAYNLFEANELLNVNSK